MFKKYMARFNDQNFRILWFEALLFAVIVGTALHSWVGVGVLFAGLCWLLNRRRGTVYMIFALSALWGFLAGSLGYGLGGWGWAVVLGGLALMSGIKVHYRDLKRPFESVGLEQINARQWRQNWHFGGQNLN